MYIDDILYYVNLLIIQYNNKPKAKATIELFIKALIAQDSNSGDNLNFAVRDGFNIDTAVGVQLDVIGVIVGINRFYDGIEITEPFFAMVEYTDIPGPYLTNQTGFSDYTDFETKVGKWLTYSGIASGSLSLGDSDYRTIIKLKIIQNNSNHSHKSIDESLFDFFGTDVRASSAGDMEMVYFIPSTSTALIDVAIQKNVLPRPMAVGLEVISTTSTFFGFSTYDTIYPLNTGFSTYADYDTKVGETLTYDKLIGV